MKAAATGKARDRVPATAPPPRRAFGHDRNIRLCEFGLCAAITLYVVVCHFVFFGHRGGLWRDEVHIVTVATSPTFSEFWKNLAIDTFPALWPATVRGWTSLYSESDDSLRVLGLLVGLTIVAALWWAVWQVGRGFPVLSLALFALCPAVIRYGDTVRGYGLGLFFLLLMHAQVWKAASAPTARRIGVGLVTALLAVLSMYFNAVILLALGAATAVLAVRRRSWTPVLATGGIGLAAAVSLLPFVGPISRHNEWREIMHFDMTFSWLAQKVCDATNTAGAFAIWVWLGGTVLAAAAAAYTAARSASDRREYDAGIFAGAAVVAGIAIYTAFIFSVGQRTNMWYYLPLMAMLAVSFDAVVEASELARRHGRIARLCAAAVLFALTVPAAWTQCHLRMTNVDLVAQNLEQNAGRDDLIVLAPWWPAATFSRYYHGPAPWTALPDVGQTPLQRYDLFKKRMGEKDAIEPVLQRVHAALSGGHRVWIVGHLPPRPDEPPQSPPPIPEGPMEESPYVMAWSNQMSYFLGQHAPRGGKVELPPADPTTEEERVDLLWCEGWK